MIGEFLRELAVLIFVFVPLELGRDPAEIIASSRQFSAVLLRLQSLA
jgi:hypothetical protein